MWLCLLLRGSELLQPLSDTGRRAPHTTKPNLQPSHPHSELQGEFTKSITCFPDGPVSCAIICVQKIRKHCSDVHCLVQEDQAPCNTFGVGTQPGLVALPSWVSCKGETSAGALSVPLIPSDA